MQLTQGNAVIQIEGERVVSNEKMQDESFAKIGHFQSTPAKRLSQDHTGYYGGDRLGPKIGQNPL